MTKDQLSQLGTLVGLFDTCAKMGGTRPFERIQPIVAAELKKLLDDIESEEEKKPEPRPSQRPAPKVHSETSLASSTETDRRV